jgi:hypothetical protein
METVAHGRLQLDGLVQSCRFDLILRSLCTLPETTRNDISKTFEEARNIAAFAGDISFVAGRDFVGPPVAVEAHSTGVTV